MSWYLPATAYWLPLPDDIDVEASTREVLQKTVVETLGPILASAVSLVVVEGRPASVLIEQSQEAELLVVGSRGHGEFSGMLIGSVSEHCVSHAPCPVVVVRPPNPPR